MRFILSVIICALANICAAQLQPNINELRLINNEKDFVIASQIHGVGNGFIQYMRPGTISVNKGVVDAYAKWLKRRQAYFSLVWKPSAVFATADGLHGITSGPHYHLAGKDTALTKGGYFLSVWSRASATDSFKLDFDSGMDAPAYQSSDDALNIIRVEKRAGISSFPSFNTEALLSFKNAVLKSGANNQLLLLSQYGMFYGNEIKALNELDQPTLLTVEKEFDAGSLHVVIAKIVFSKNQFDASKKLSANGWMTQVWNTEKNKEGLLATLLQIDP